MDHNYNNRKRRVRELGVATLSTNIPVDVDDRIVGWQVLLREQFNRCATKSDLIEMSLDALDLVVFLAVHLDKPHTSKKQLFEALEKTIRKGEKLRIRVKVQPVSSPVLIEAAE